MHKHVTVWLDQKEARVFHLEADRTDETTVTAQEHAHHKHPRGPEGEHPHPDDARRFFHQIMQTLSGNEQILLVGPSTTKLDFLRYVHKHDPRMEPRIIGIETVDHPTSGQLVAYAKHYFRQSPRAH